MTFLIDKNRTYCWPHIGEKNIEQENLTHLNPDFEHEVPKLFLFTGLMPGYISAYPYV